MSKPKGDATAPDRTDTSGVKIFYRRFNCSFVGGLMSPNYFECLVNTPIFSTKLGPITNLELDYFLN